MASAPRTSNGLFTNIIYLVVLALAGIIIYKTCNGESITKGLSDYTFIPKEYTINYVPADFQYDLNDEDVLGILSNPYRYEREFDGLVKDVNLNMLNHVAKRMNLPDSLKGEVAIAYQQHHPYLSDLFFNEFVAQADTSAAEFQAWYSNESNNAVSIFNEVASKYTCFLVNHVLTTLLETNDGKLNLKGSKIDTPCGIAMTEGLRPMIDRLREKAAVKDFARAKGLMAEKVEKSIAELGTMEVRDRKGINKQLQTKMFGMNVSETELEISAISILKVGFNLNDFFDIQVDSKAKKVQVTLPQPTVLSHEVYPKIDKLDIGWMREVQNVDFNKNINLLRTEFRKDAMESDIFEKSKIKAQELLDLMMSPVVKAIGNKYSLIVKFQGARINTENAKPAHNESETIDFR